MTENKPEGGDELRPDSDELTQAEESGQPFYGDPSVTALDDEAFEEDAR